MLGYVTRADDLILHRIPSEHRMMSYYPWGTHALVALEFVTVGRHASRNIGVVHALLGAIPAGCAALITARFVKSRFAIFLAGVLVAIWHPHVVYSGFFSSEVWFSALITIHAWLFIRSSYRGSWGLLGAGLTTAITFAVRPQFLITWGLVTLVDVIRRREPPARASTGRPLLRDRTSWRVAMLGLPLMAMMTFSAIRFHRITGRVGLISDNGPVQRVFGETDVGRLESTWTAANGDRWGFWFCPNPKRPVAEKDIVRFEGYIGDPAIMALITKQRLTGVPYSARLRRMFDNVTLLASRNRIWPEEEYRGVRFRAQLQDIFEVATVIVLPFTALGLYLTRRRPEALVLVANVFTILLVGALYLGEARYRVPYDPFMLVFGVIGAHGLARWLAGLPRRWKAWRTRARAPEASAREASVTGQRT